MLAVNLGTAGAKEAAELLEYCNLPVGTSIADERAANGHPEPYRREDCGAWATRWMRPGKQGTSRRRPMPSEPAPLGPS